LGSDEAWTRRLYAALKSEGFDLLVQGPIAHAVEMLTTPEAKARARAASGALAADMESYGVAEVAAARALPFTALRVIADTSEDALPSVAVAAATPDGRINVMKSLLGALMHPGQIPELIRLGRRTDLAREQLRRLADLGLARGFFV